MKEIKCSVEWCNNPYHKVCNCSEDNKPYCGRHYQQMRSNGEIKRSRGDLNEVTIKGALAEIILYDINYNEKARAIIDSEDVNKINKYKWVLRTDGYVSSKIEGKGIKLHRFINNTPKGMHTNHMNLNKLDNRKINLETCTQLQNNQFKGLYSKNKVGKNNIFFRDNMYEVDIRVENKSIYLGYFKELYEAVICKEVAELKYFTRLTPRSKELQLYMNNYEQQLNNNLQC